MADRNICYRVLLQKRELFFDELVNIKGLLFLIHKLFTQIANFPEISHNKQVVNVHDSSLGCVNARYTKA